VIPFVPDNRGQSDIVNGREELLYHTMTEAVEQIDRVLSGPARRRDVRLEPECGEARFGRNRFREEICTLVDETIDGEKQEQRLAGLSKT